MNDPYLVFEVNPSGLVPQRTRAVLAFLFIVLLSHVVLFSNNSGTAPIPPQAPHRLAITFDDGPHPAFTHRLLKILRQERVHATFFVVGSQIARYPHLLQAISRDGHQIANHTYHHYNMTTLAPAKILSELDETQRLIERITGQKARFFRPPGGQ
jgi:peptidoglycan/xylan/chitin deacetylase (PgdA/CDA1 family)